MFQKKTFQLNHCGPHTFDANGPHAPKWYIVDAKDQVVGRIASILARVITGKHKPTFTRHADAGDFVVVINARDVVLTRNKWRDKKYYDYSGYVGGLKIKSAQELLDRNPEDILWRAVWGMTGKSRLAERQIKKLKIYPTAEHPHLAQQPQPFSAEIIRKTVLANTPKVEK